MELTKELEQIIRNNLPAQVGETLQKVLAEGQEAKRLLEQKTTRIAELEGSLARLLAENEQLRAFKRESANLDARARGLDEEERNLKVQMLELQVKEAERRADVVTSLVDRFVRNVDVRRSITGPGEAVVVMPPQFSGGTPSVHQPYVSKTETETVE